MNRTLRKNLSLFVLLCLTAQTFAQSAAPAFPNPGKTSMSREKQQALGMEVAAQVYQQMPVLPDNSPETQYVRQIGQKLIDTIPQKNSWPFKFHVIPQKEINVFAIPGCQMFINLGILNYVMNFFFFKQKTAYEMAHVYMQ